LSTLLVISSSYALAGSRFNSSYPCSNAGKYCVSSGTREVEGFQVTRDCWEWAYTKKCNYPSKNDCSKYGHCYSLGQRDCLLRDSVGNCVNLKKEFSCKRWTPVVIESDTVRYGTKDKDGIEGLVCEGVPCIDGNCINKSYEMDEDMVSSVAQLGALSQGKSDGVNFKIFEGQVRHCTKKPAGYHNCCKVFPKGWGKNLGAKCSKDENILSEKRRANLCVYAAKESKKTLGVTTLIKHHYCCFSNIIEKVVQVEARKQLVMSFGSGSSPNCRGLTLDELDRVDFSKMDFSEFAADVMKKLSIPDIEDAESRIHSAFKTTRRFDESRPALADNRLSGINQTLIGPTEEEIRLEEERLARLEEERLEAERLEQERIAREEREREIRLAQEQRRNHLENLKRKKELELEEIKPKLENENELSSLHLASSSVINAHPSFWTKHKKLYKDSMLRASFLKSTKTRLEKELKEIEEEFNNILLPDHLKQKRETKQVELNIAKAGLEKVRTEFDHNDYGNSTLKIIYYQREINRLEKDLREEAY
jgi:conjugal transfer mating pair stabilization protein TraN